MKGKKARFIKPGENKKTACEIWNDAVRTNPRGLSAEALADRMQCGVSMVYRYGEDQCDTMQRVINGIVAIAAEGGDYRLIEMMAERVGMRLVPISEVALGAGTLLTTSADIMRETSDVMMAISDSIADGKVTEDEAARIGNEASEAIVKLEQLRAAADAAVLEGAA